ncbi:GNAT family N-acetyltransferase [Leptospira sp. WS92.C1]
MKSFRYFSSRSVSIINHHLLSVILLNEGKPVAYGHLDPEDTKVWLGIAVIEEAVGKGYGRKMMTFLIESAREKNIPVLTLSVDHGNQSAIRLYLNSGFQKISETEKFELYEWKNEDRS